MKFSSILKKINFKSRKSMLKTGAILFWTDTERLFNWNMDNFRSNFLSRGQLGSKSNDKFFLSVLRMWQCCKYFLGNLIFALTARTLRGNCLNILFLLSLIIFVMILFNPPNPNINMHDPLNVFHILVMLLFWRICLHIKTSYLWWSFLYFSWPVCVIK